MSIIIPANSATSGGFEVANSLRFNTGSSDSLTRTQSASPTSATKGTLSFWIKRSLLGTSQYFMSTFQDSNNRVQCEFQADNTLRIIQKNSSATTINIITNRVFTDPSAFYHVVLAFDTTQDSSDDRVKLYINGVRETSFSTNTRPSLNIDSFLTKGTSASLGAYNGTGDYSSAYFSEIVLIDGQQLAPTSFGEFDEDSGTWKPIDVSGLTFGTNGYYLDFEDSSALGNDAAGSNNFTVNNLTALDQVTDTCTNNFAVANNNDNFFANAVFAEGNIKVTTNSTAEAMSTGTIALSAGRWYYEIDIIDRGSTAQVGFTPHGSRVLSGVSGKAGDVTPFTQAYMNTGKVQTGNGSGGQTDLATLSSYTTGNIIGVYLDLVDFKSYWSKDGVLQNSGTGLNITALNANSHGVGGGTGVYIPYVGDNSSGTPAVFELNFGNPFQSQSSSVTDDNGFGKFEYSPNITGDGTAKSFFAICTKNLAATGG